MEGDASEIQKLIEQRIGELPADIQEVILSSNFNEKIFNIGSNNSLHVDKIQLLGDNTMLVMLGFMNEDEYGKEVGNLVGENSTAARKIVSEINSQIFLPIRESMKKFAESQRKAPEVISSTSAPATSTPAKEIHPADLMLTQKTVATPAPTPPPSTSVPNTAPPAQKVEPPKPVDYKADPYREPLI